MSEKHYNSKTDGDYDYYILEIWRPASMGGPHAVTNLLNESQMDAVLNALMMVWTAGVFGD